MRTVIRGGWVVGFGGSTHTLIPNGVLVYEDKRIIHVGKEYDGPADAEIDAAGKLVAPGFVDVHMHSGDRAGHRLITDVGRPEYFGMPLLDAGLQRAQPKNASPPPRTAEEEKAAATRLELEATYTVAELLRNGITTL